MVKMGREFEVNEIAEDGVCCSSRPTKEACFDWMKASGVTAETIPLASGTLFWG
jgi:hypothetical protein